MKPTSFKSETTPWRVQVPGRYSADGKRKTKYFKTKDEASAFCRQAKKPGFTLDGFISPVSKAEEDEWSVAVRRFAALYDGDLGLAYMAHERHKKLIDIKPATVRQAIELFQAWRMERVKKGELKKSTVSWTDRPRLNELIKAFEHVQLSDLTEVRLREFFDRYGKNAINIQKSAKVFFGWAIKYGYLIENPMARIEKLGEYGVKNEYYSVETFARMLRIAAGFEAPRPGQAPTRDFIDLLSFFVLGGFAGLRSCERVRGYAGDALRWSDLYFDAEHPNIEIRDEVAKRTRRKGGDLHYVDADYALEAIQAWLPLCPRGSSPFICPWTKRYFQKARQRFTEVTGIKFLHNGFRNSFATYALSYNGLQGLGTVARQMGDLEQTVRKHYAQNLPAGSGKAWFGLRPTPANVISISAAA